jgi:hypothetical protein
MRHVGGMGTMQAGLESRLMRLLILTLGLLWGGSALAQFTAVPVAGTVIVGSASSRTDGSGRRADDVRALEPFSAVKIDGPIDVVLKASDREQVTVNFDDNLLQLIETRVIAGAAPVLDIRIQPTAGFKSSRKPKVVIEFKSISALSLRGSGDVHADVLRGPLLAISIAGSSDVKVDHMDVDVLGVSIGGNGDFTATGRADEQGYNIAGSGDVLAGDLVGQTVKVRIAGSGDVRVHAQQLLDVAVAGAGDVLYRGSPMIRKSIAGSGEVRKAK